MAHRNLLVIQNASKQQLDSVDDLLDQEAHRFSYVENVFIFETSGQNKTDKIVAALKATTVEFLLLHLHVGAGSYLDGDISITNADITKLEDILF